ncbi:MAG: tRNA (adenosine(37)-N6)-threonylcarbamoyltransferase complex dimerization subunit type 1 TsaB [Candidatus Omnitrophica bacterium]|nr:tRNA (adenosine(37)-N6)-threonylcarbamoyltransferase complex dimerization subunit type 1 TsaB [Candidatus Omnitrophota bacterium]MDD5137674.1 tRNA (adenosine(37)-N6)-threonylcarbamoyltransferase complex dimerization subunit type 1 TsaB [Candidatus Omnitrophota bacterium]MDD5537849.1 tRNA (adenosine(37)-N6)-threonylcarbamoyltransferase complex dimerization subunit type 1 TsaB [Candidatus Omnitrophota bacterium]
MNFLCLDTSTAYSVVAVADEKKVLAGARRQFEKGRAEGIFDLVEACLHRSGLALKDIDAFGVGIGPGSFTGLRIGLSAVKGFAFASSRPVYPFSSLTAVAFNAVHIPAQRLAVAVDARRSHVYAAEFKRDGRGEFLPLRKDALLEVNRWLGRLGAHAVLAGDAVKMYAPELRKRLGVFGSLEEDLWYPTPEGIAALTRKVFREKRKTDAQGLEAAYLYAQDCQVKRTH